MYNSGRLRGLILRKALCALLKYKAYSTPISTVKNADGGIPLAQAATFFYDTLEKHYPNYPDVRSIKLIEKEMVRLINSFPIIIRYFFRFSLLIIV